MKIELLGTSFSIQTDEDPQHLNDIVDYLKTKIQEVRSSVSTSDQLKLAILAALLITDELFKERAEIRDTRLQSDQLEEMTQLILSRLEQTLPPAQELSGGDADSVQDGTANTRAGSSSE